MANLNNLFCPGYANIEILSKSQTERDMADSQPSYEVAVAEFPVGNKSLDGFHRDNVKEMFDECNLLGEIGCPILVIRVKVYWD